MKPFKGYIYSIEEVFSLELRDRPFLTVGDRPLMVEGIPLQTAHLKQEDIILLFSGTNWVFVEETTEWIPVFRLMK